MAASKLSSEFVSLVHHVELNQAGWWDNTIQRLLIAMLWSSQRSLSFQYIYRNLQDMYKIQIPGSRVQNYIEELQSKDIIIKLSNGEYKISEDHKKVIEEGIRTYNEVEERVKALLNGLITNYCPSLDNETMWITINEELISPLVAELGARTYDIISQSVTDVDRSTSFADFINQFPADIHGALRSVVISFLSPDNSDVRSYVLWQLNAYFSKIASSLDHNTIDLIAKRSNKNVSLTIFLDTNFLFSILGLHDNPSNEAASSLLDLIKAIAGTLNIKLYVSEATVEETRVVLINQTDNIRSICSHKMMCDIIQEASVSSVLRKFVKANIDSGYSLDPDTFFSPYINDLATIIKSHGIYIHRDPLDDLRSDPNVLDDLNDQLDFEARIYHDRAKKYSSLLHDMMLWHFVKKKRPSVVESPLDAKYWIATVDYRFIRFDAYKRRTNSVRIPITVDPTTLIQMLQFWVPRSEDLEKALIESLRLPFLFQEFDIEAEKITVKILNTLSRFENVDDLPKDSLVSIVLNQGLRNKIIEMDNESEEEVLIREALIEEHRRVTDELQESLTREGNLSKNIDKSAEEISNLRVELEALQQQNEIRKEQWERVRFSAIYLVFPAIIYFASAGWVYTWNVQILTLNLYDIICIYSLVGILYLALSCSIGKRKDHIRRWSAFIILNRIKKYIIGVIIVGILVNLITKVPENTSLFSKEGAVKPSYTEK